jgi:amino acid transporter
VTLQVSSTARPTTQDGPVHFRRSRAQGSVGDLGRFVVGTRRGRVLAFLFLAAAALLGLVLGVLGASETASSLAIIAYVGMAIPVILLQASKATDPRHDRQQ